MNSTRSHFHRALCRLCIAAALLAAATGCKPTPPPGMKQAPPPTESSAPRQPTASDLRVFFQSLLPAEVKVSDLKIDPPVRMPNTSPASNVWIVSTKLTLTPAEDLLSLPSTEDTKVIDALAGELNALVAWRNIYINTPYAKACGSLEIKVPTSPTPQLLVVAQPKNQSLPPIYGQVSAEWQVDHWQFTNVSLTFPKVGELRSRYQGAVMVKGGPEEKQILGGLHDAIAQARQQIEAVKSRYAEEFIKSTAPGTVYRGQINHPRGALPCELRFVDPPKGTAQMAAFEVRLLNEPYQFAFTAKVAPQIPVDVPASSAGDRSFRIADDTPSPPRGNLTTNFVRGTGKDHEGKSFPGLLLRGLEAGWAQHGLPLVVINQRVEGVLASNGGDFVVSAQLTP